MYAVTLEPVATLYYITFSLTAVTGQNLLLQKACHPGDSVPLASAVCEDELNAQKRATVIQTWRDSIALYGPVFFVLFAGPWSDNHGKRRKPLMYVPLCGQVLSDLLCMLNIYYWRWPPSVAALTQSILPAVTGSRPCFIMGVNSYTADKISEETMTTRLGIYVILNFLGGLVSCFLFGLLYPRIGFYGLYLLCVLFNSVAFVYLFLFISEREQDKDINNLKFWEGAIDPKSVVQSLNTICKPRKGYQRAVVLLGVIVGPITVAPLQGEYNVLYFFLRFKFNWNEVDFGFYAAYKSIILFLGGVITLGVFSKVFAIPDAIIGMMASATLMAASIGYAFSDATWQLFFYPIVDFMHGGGLAVVLSIVSKCVESKELGQVNSILGVADAAFPLINLPLYNQVYNYTLTVLTGAFFLISFMYGAIALVVFGVIYVLQRKQSQEEKTSCK